jgi:hypothetical protein
MATARAAGSSKDGAKSSKDVPRRGRNSAQVRGRIRGLTCRGSQVQVPHRHHLTPRTERWGFAIRTRGSRSRPEPPVTVRRTPRRAGEVAKDRARRMANGCIYPGPRDGTSREPFSQGKAHLPAGTAAMRVVFCRQCPGGSPQVAWVIPLCGEMPCGSVQRMGRDTVRRRSVVVVVVREDRAG